MKPLFHATSLIALLASCGCRALPPADGGTAPPSSLDAQDVVWTTPSADAKGSMPLGNGEVVVNAWVEGKTGDLMLLVARTDALSETCRFLKLGRIRLHFEGGPLAQAKDFRQEVKLRRGVVEISGGGLALKVFVDSDAHVLHVAGTGATPLAATATVECWRDQERPIGDDSSWTTRRAPFPRSESADRFLPPSGNAVVFCHRNEHSVVPKLWENQALTGLPGAFDPLIHHTFGGKLSGTGFVASGDRAIRTSAARTSFDLRLATHTARTDTVEQWRDGLEAQDAASADASAALARTRAWWDGFWRRSWVIAKERSDVAIPANSHPLRIGVDSAGGSRFAGEIEPQPVAAQAATPAQIAALAAAGHGTRASMEPPVMPAAAKGITFSAWIKPTGNAVGRIFDKCTAGREDGILFDAWPANVLRLQIGSRVIRSAAVLKPGQWQHVAATYDGASGETTLYLDGKPVGRGEARGPVSRGYALQRYAQGFQGRGAYPIKFNGGFFRADDANPDWRLWGDCHWWQNVRHMYHPMLACGDFDLMDPLFRMYESIRPLAESRTKLYFGAEGAFFPETVTVFGTYAGGDYGWDRRGRKPGEVAMPYWRYAWNQGPELVSLMLDRWDYTHDEAFLKTQLLPMAHSVLRYFDTRFRKDAAGKILVDPAQALETYYPGVTNDAPTAAGLANVTRRLAALPEALVPAEQRAFFARMQAAAPAVPVDAAADGTRKLAPAATYQPRRHNVENPELYAVWPYREVSLSRPALLAEGKAAFVRRGSHNPTGWGYDANAAALLGLTDAAAKDLLIKCDNSCKGYRWPATWGPNWDGEPDQNHGGNLLETTNLMLLQGESGGKILLLPAWPKDWDVDFKLHAPDRTTVECRVEGGKVVKLVVTPESRRKDVELCAPFTMNR